MLILVISTMSMCRDFFSTPKFKIAPKKINSVYPYTEFAFAIIGKIMRRLR